MRQISERKRNYTEDASLKKIKMKKERKKKRTGIYVELWLKLQRLEKPDVRLADREELTHPLMFQLNKQQQCRRRNAAEGGGGSGLGG